MKELMRVLSPDMLVIKFQYLWHKQEIVLVVVKQAAASCFFSGEILKYQIIQKLIAKVVVAFQGLTSIRLMLQWCT